MFYMVATCWKRQQVARLGQYVTTNIPNWSGLSDVFGSSVPKQLIWMQNLNILQVSGRV